jgi:hypothetical protein
MRYLERSARRGGRAWDTRHLTGGEAGQRSTSATGSRDRTEKASNGRTRGPTQCRPGGEVQCAPHAPEQPAGSRSPVRVGDGLGWRDVGWGCGDDEHADWVGLGKAPETSASLMYVDGQRTVRVGSELNLRPR